MSKRVPKLDGDWTAEEAWAADEAYRRAGGKPSPNSPWMWWHGQRRLRELEAKCRKLLPDEKDFTAALAAGGMRPVMEAIDTCAMHEWPIPQWAAQPFRVAMANLRFFVAPTWNDAFGSAPYLRPGASIRKARDGHAREMRAHRIYLDITRACLPICKETFKKMGVLHGVSGRTAEEDYTRARKGLPKDSRTPLKRGRKPRAKGAS
jgi:hypothetical protein